MRHLDLFLREPPPLVGSSGAGEGAERMNGPADRRAAAIIVAITALRRLLAWDVARGGSLRR